VRRVTAILGINAYHADSAACLVVDGELVGAVEEERFCRLKHWAGFPEQAIRWCLDAGGLTLADVDHVALNKKPRSNVGRKLRYTVARRPSPKLLRERLASARSWLAIEDELRHAFPDEELHAQVHRVEHHLAHLASAFLVSPYEDAVIVSVDGFGDFVSSAWGLGRGNDVSIDGRVYFPHSLGVFYEALTQYLGFPHYGDEYKVMGLAPYGEPTHLPQLERVVLLQDDGTFELDLSYFRHHDRSVGYQWHNTTPQSGTLWSERLVELLGPARDPEEPLEQRHRDVARSVQAVYERAYFNLLRALASRYDGVRRLCVAGGCGANSVANGKVQDETPFKESFVAPATGDAGGAIGSALLVWQRIAHTAARASDSAYLGPEYGDGEIAATLAASGDVLAAAGCRVEELRDENALCERVASAVADGLVVGWFQGRLEWGPRALGNRSIVCDPRRSDMKEILNRKIKRRESFRPFAPSVLREATAEWFAHDDDVPYMSKVFQIRPERREQVPAVTHVDGSGRLQTIERAENPRYYELIASFARKTGVPMVLNTSFNENEPIVNTPAEALDCFLRTNMDVLVLGDTVVERPRT
jgi:carbamoyltransferase